MATQIYDALIGKVRDWSNRDTEVLNNTVINDCLEYAADDAYRILRIPPLESVRTYTTTAEGRALTIPSDLSSFIQIRRVQPDGGGAYYGTSPYIVYTEKADIRSFYDVETNKQEYFRWTRQVNEIHVYPDYNEGDQFELYYYRRLPPLDSTYVVNAANANAGRVTFDSMATAEDPTTGLCELFREGTEAPYTYHDTQNADMSYTAVYGRGNESPNWLKDNHERTLLYGALSYAFAYLQELEQAQVYKALFTEELQKLNSEENYRKYQGGNSVIHFSTGGLI